MNWDRPKHEGAVDRRAAKDERLAEDWLTKYDPKRWRDPKHKKRKNELKGKKLDIT